MAVNDLEVLYEQLPEVFAIREQPAVWEDEWIVILIDEPEAWIAGEIEQLIDFGNFPEDAPNLVEPGPNPPPWPSTEQLGMPRSWSASSWGEYRAR